MLWLIYYNHNLTKSDKTYPTYKKITKDVEHLTLAETWTHFKLEEKQLQCLRCKQMYHCIPVTLKVGILLKVKQSPDDVDNSSYYWLHSVKSQLLYMHLKLELKAFTVYRSVLLAKRKQSKYKILSTSICGTSLFEPWLQWILLSIIATWVNIKWIVFQVPPKHVIWRLCSYNIGHMSEENNEELCFV